MITVNNNCWLITLDSVVKKIIVVLQGVNLSSLKYIKKDANYRTVYCHIASRVRSVLPFVKVAYPDLVGGESVSYDEPLNLKDRRTCR